MTMTRTATRVRVQHATAPKRRRAGLRLMSVAALLLSGVLLSGMSLRPDRAPIVTPTPATTSSKAIEDLRVGDRVVAGNPEGSEPDEAEPDPRTWHVARLVLSDPEGGEVEATLLRSPTWFSDSGARLGGTIHLDLPEMGVSGEARVLSIDTCLPIASGTGRVVTGTFTRRSDRVIDLHIGDEVEPISVTATHPIWSEDRQAFVSAGELRAGERLKGVDGPASVTTVATRPGHHCVYNIEVQGEHVYRVSSLGILVHNNCPIVIGETMPSRVKPVAAAIGAATFAPRSTNALRFMINQKNWIGKQIGSGRRIFDIGKDGTRVIRSPYYAAEINALQNAGYERTFVRWVTGDNGRRFRLYEWTLK